MIQERIKRDYTSIQLPTIFEEEDRGFFRCCEPELVLASGTADSWKNDITPAWIKLSDVADTVEFILESCGIVTTYIPEAVPFVKEANAFYTEINWKDVLSSDGEGNFTLRIVANISGIPFDFVWGEYILKQYSVQNAKGTARLRGVFNAYHEIERIDFTDSMVNGTFRFKGMIGFRKPNKQTDNLIYNDRQMKSVIRENLNVYELKTDPLKEEFISKLTDLYLLSETQLFASDYNAHNNSYKYLDLPVTIEESDEIEHYELSRDSKLTAMLTDRKKDKRTYFK